MRARLEARSPVRAGSFSRGVLISASTTVVVAGYGSWAMTRVNPAAESVKLLAGKGLNSCSLHCLEAPVDSAQLYSWLESSLKQYKPEIWIGVGVAVGSPSIRLESIGLNVKVFDVPDNNGLSFEGAEIVEGAPVAYGSNLEHQSILHNLRRAGIPAVVSYHAGTHLCNQMLYSLMHIKEAQRLDLIGGFIHVPQSTDNAAQLARGETPCSSMDLQLMAQALAITVDCSVQQRASTQSYA